MSSIETETDCKKQLDISNNESELSSLNIDSTRPTYFQENKMEVKNNIEFVGFSIKVEPVEEYECEETTQQVETETKSEAEIFEKHGQLHSTLVIKEEEAEEKDEALHQPSIEFVDISKIKKEVEDVILPPRPVFKNLTCSICHKIFQKRCKFLKHMKNIHDIIKPYTCDLCTNSYKELSHLTRHYNCTHSELRPFKCDKCKKCFKQKEILKFHILCTHSNSTYYCEFCPGKTYKTKLSLSKHIRSCYAASIFPPEYYNNIKCHKCVDKTFKSKRTLSAHIKRIHSNCQPMTCNYCGKLCQTIYHLKSHKRIHIKKPKHKCHLCGGSYKSKTNLVRHVKTIHNKQTFKCEHCEKSYAREDSFKKHLSTHEEGYKGNVNIDNGIRFYCDLCPYKRFKTKIYIQRHIRTVHAETIIHPKKLKSYKCDVCNDKKFKSKASLVNHKRLIHSNMEPVPCDICGKAFKRREYLIKHKEIHNLVPQHKCDICGSLFKQKENLLKHKKYVHDNRVFHCDQCFKSYSREDTLKTHKLKHQQGLIEDLVKVYKEGNYHTQKFNPQFYLINKPNIGNM